MDDYPTPDDEFDLMYADELELLRDNDEFSDDRIVVPNKPSNKVKILENVVIETANTSRENNKENFANSKHYNDEFPSTSSSKVSILENVLIGTTSRQNNKEHFVINKDYNDEFSNTPSSSFSILENVHRSANKPSQIFSNEMADISDVHQSQVDLFAKASQPSAKRSIRELFGDIDDIEREDMLTLPKPKKLKSDKKDIHEELALIEHILQMRKLAKERRGLEHAFNVTGTIIPAIEDTSYNISYRVPKYPFLGVTKQDGERVYVRFHNEQYMKEETQRVVAESSFNGIMGSHFHEILNEANEILEKSTLQPDLSNISIQTQSRVRGANESLWVDTYKPQKYIELLSDESTNRLMLQWLKLWDKVVFGRRVKPVKMDAFGTKTPHNFNLDEDGRPHCKVALLCGPPGLGKTTLAHIIAKHAGYKVVEINASDDRNMESFKSALENATQMTSVLDSEDRPNCLVFDEIDGAPSSSIEYLIKYVNGVSKTSKKGKKLKANVLKRPIICICNDVYVPSLRNLRQIAFVVHFPPTSTARLTERLRGIAQKEGITVSNNVLTALAEKSNNDIRSCLSTLNFFKAKDKPITLAEVLSSSFGQKDVQKGLFSVWQDIFHISKPKRNDDVLTTMRTRWKKVLSTVTSFGDYDRLANGVFENYPAMNVRDSTMASTCMALDWFCYFDQLNTQINRTQNYSLGCYLQYGFIVWHYAFAGNQWPKIAYPTKMNEVRTNRTRTESIVGEVLKGMKPSIRTYCGTMAIKFDVLPLLYKIITPMLRPVNLHLYTKDEKETLARVVDAMIDYNLTYVQERNPEGSYVFNIDPNIDLIVNFELKSSSSKEQQLSYAHKQLISHEIETERMKRLDLTRGQSNSDDKQPTKVPNHLQKLQPKPQQQQRRMAPRHFFQLPSTLTPSQEARADPHYVKQLDVWFEYKEGHTNAVKRRVKNSFWLD